MILKQINTIKSKRSYIKTETSGWKQITNADFLARCEQIDILTATILNTAIPGGFETRVIG